MLIAYRLFTNYTAFSGVTSFCVLVSTGFIIPNYWSCSTIATCVLEDHKCFLVDSLCSAKAPILLNFEGNCFLWPYLGVDYYVIRVPSLSHPNAFKTFRQWFMVHLQPFFLDHILLPALLWLLLILYDIISMTITKCK